MISHSHDTAPTQFATADGIRFAYRRFGKHGSVPLIFLQYFSGNMDNWDPAVTNGFATDHEVILFDNAGVGSSGGETPASVLEMTRAVVSFLNALGVEKIDAVRFSLGGMIAQQLALDHPKLLRRIILLGTGPRGGEGMTFTELSVAETKDEDILLQSAFFCPSATSQAAGKAFLQRLRNAQVRAVSGFRPGFSSVCKLRSIAFAAILAVASLQGCASVAGRPELHPDKWAPRRADREWVAQPAAMSTYVSDTSVGIDSHWSVTAQTGREYDLPELIDIALRNNPGTQRAWSVARSTADSLGAAQAPYYPQISFS